MSRDQVGCCSGWDRGGVVSEPVEVAVRLNVPLIPKAAEALARLEDRTSKSKADVINRALQLYDFVESERAQGHSLAVVDADGRTAPVTMT